MAQIGKAKMHIMKRLREAAKIYSRLGTGDSMMKHPLFLFLRLSKCGTYMNTPINDEKPATTLKPHAKDLPEPVTHQCLIDKLPVWSYWSSDDLVCSRCGFVIYGANKGTKRQSWIGPFGTFVGKCMETDKMLKYPGDCRRLDDRDFLCNCHNLIVLSVQQVDVIEQRDDGWYWVKDGP